MEQKKWNEELGRIVRFGITGSLSTLIHYGVYLLTLLWFSPTIAYVSFCVNYVLTTLFTFKKRPSSKNAAGFAASHVLNYLLEIGILNAFLYYGMEKRLAGILVIIVVVPVNFLILRFVFVRKQ